MLDAGSFQPLCAVDKLDLRFSSTANYDIEAKQQLEATPGILIDWREKIHIPPPPGNNSARVKSELAELHRLEKERSQATEALIDAEQTLAGFKFGDAPYSQLAQRAPAMKRLIDLTIGEAIPIIFALKKQHDRVRPSALDPTLTPCIEIPGHATYPSGHATQAYLFAYLYSEVDPANTENYFRRASEIAIRREEAGIHFSSDTEAGRELARQIHRALSDQATYLEELTSARMEFYHGELPEEFLPPRDPYEILAEQRQEKKRRQEAEKARATRKPEKSEGFIKSLLNRFKGE